MNRIKTIEYGEVKKLAEIFACTPRTVNNALREGRGRDAAKIRTAALRRGAVEVVSNTNK